MTTTKYEIREKTFEYQDNAGNKNVGSKFSVWNTRTNRKLGQHRSKEQAEKQIAKIQERKIRQRLTRKTKVPPGNYIVQTQSMTIKKNSKGGTTIDRKHIILEGEHKGAVVCGDKQSID